MYGPVCTVVWEGEAARPTPIPIFRAVSFLWLMPAGKGFLSGRAYDEGIAAMLTIIKASLLGSVLMLLEGCASYSTKTSCDNQGPDICQCVRYTTINRSWVDCR